MDDLRRFRIATGLTVCAAGIVGYWIAELYPFWTHTGPAPGAGAQYVFVLIPTAAVACLASLTAVTLIVPDLRRNASLRSPLRVTVAIIALSMALMLCAFWANFGINVFSRR
jgi:hypothetical protein